MSHLSKLVGPFHLWLGLLSLGDRDHHVVAGAAQDDGRLWYLVQDILQIAHLKKWSAKNTSTYNVSLLLKEIKIKTIPFHKQFRVEIGFLKSYYEN